MRAPHTHALICTHAPSLSADEQMRLIEQLRTQLAEKDAKLDEETQKRKATEEAAAQAAKKAKPASPRRSARFKDD